jgi:hypothetical protein
MTDNSNIAIDSTEAVDPAVDGQVDEVLGNDAETLDAEPELFDYTEVADKYVKLQVDGQEVVVPVKEALAGYQRQADYTRKTQELSEQRRQVQYAMALQEALQQDPASTLQLLSQQLGVNQVLPQEEEELWIDPSEKQLRLLEQRISAFEQERAMEELARTIDSLQGKYGEDFNPDEVIAKALAIGSTDLEAVFKQISFDKVYSKASDAQNKLKAEQERVAAKRQAAVISGGTSVKTSPPQSAQPKSVFEAFEAAKKQLNL